MKDRNLFSCIFLILIILIYESDETLAFTKRGNPSNDTYYKNFFMPGVTPIEKDQYICTGMPLNSTHEEWVLKYEPLLSADRAHHMLLFGCSDVSQENLRAGSWNCPHLEVCSGNKVIYGWGKNAPSANLPTDVGFRIGGNSGIKFLVLQIHYVKPLPNSEKDKSGLKMLVTHKEQKYKAGIYLLASRYLDIPPHSEKTHVDINCPLSIISNMNIFAYATHTHALGTVVTGYKYNMKKGELIEIARGNPHWPQVFYSMGEVVSAAPNEILHARCTFNSSTRGRHTYIGATSDDEMCNLYLMYYTDRIKGLEGSLCSLENFPDLTQILPADSDKPLPPNPLLEEMTQGENKNKDKEINYSELIRGNSKDGKIHLPTLTDFVPSDTGKKTVISNYFKEIHMPGVTPQEHDAYLCTGVALNATEEWVLKYEPLASANRAHHMLLFGCSEIQPEFLKRGYWDCGHHGVCLGQRIMYAWAKNAPATQLPPNVGFRVGGNSDIKFLALQIHYVDPLPQSEKDASGVRMHITTNPQENKAGIFLLATGMGDIPPHTPKVNLDVNCQVGESEPEEINLFAFRVHAHSLATVISGYKFNSQTNELAEIARGNPQWPQAFYPMDKVQKVHPSDILHARCTYNSTKSNKFTHIGGTAGDEMCNLYLMYFTDREKGSESGGCYYETFKRLTAALPPGSDEPLPPNPLLEEMTHGENKNKDKEVTYSNLFHKENIEIEKKTHVQKPNPLDDPFQLQPKPVYNYDDVQTLPSQHDSEVTNTADQENDYVVSISREGKELDSKFHLVENWGPKEYKLGQVTAVAVDSRGDVVIFHRGDVVWDGSSFRNNVLADKSNVIAQPTLLHLQKDSGHVMHEWGANFFHMPHGLAIDKDDNIWVTDVGMHQVFKFPSGYGEGRPLLTLGTKFEPGKDAFHFCKPTGVAIMKNGEFFVSDGYCNARIIHFNADGSIIKQFGSDSQNLPGFGIPRAKVGQFAIPHAVTLAEDRNEICVADRENGRIQCFKIADGEFSKEFQFDTWGRRLFSAVYNPSMGGRLFAVNGPHFFGKFIKVQIFEVNYEKGEIETAFSPYNQGLSNPHDLTLSTDGTELYVVEIGPNKIWKFAIAGKQNGSAQLDKTSTSKIEVETEQLAEKVDANNSLSLFSGEWSTVGVSSVILGLLAIPIVVLSTLSLLIWCRKRGNRKSYSTKGKFHNVYNKNGGLNLGSLLNKHHGFEKVSTNDLDDDDLESADSDVEEFSLAAAKV